MSSVSRLAIAIVLIASFLSSALPCGPGYVTPLFETSSAPENPYTDFAAGRLGIIKPKYRRSVLYAAYRHIVGNGMSAAEQQAVVEVWRAEIDNRDFTDNDVTEAVRAWVERRKGVVGEEEKTPEIYVERSYGGYDFFPNCTKNAFETATETLSERIGSHGSDNTNVRNWVAGQDQVFENCASGKRTPDDAPVGAPEWLQKDRAYQKAAAEFYSLDYDGARRRFAEIAEDSDSPWAETADYLVGRTLIRQASLMKDKAKAGELYDQAEQHLQKFSSRSGKFASSAERLIGLIAYRRRPRERVVELGKKLGSYGTDNFRQDLIDYTWLLDKFESDVLTAEQARKEAEKPKPTEPAFNTTNAVPPAANANGRILGKQRNDDDIELTLWSNDYTKSWTFFIRPDATDDDAIAEAEKVVGAPIDDEAKKRVREMRKNAYAGRFTADKPSGYEGGYYGEEKLTPSLVPGFLREDDLTDWLFTYQISGSEAYLHSLERYRQTSGMHWLMAAVSKAEKSSTQLDRLLEAAENASRLSPAWVTIAFHRARILLVLGKTAEARKLLDELLDMGDQLPVSARNAVLSLRLNMAETLEDYLKFSLKRPYAFDFSGDVGSIDEIIAEQKSWFDPEYNKEGREAYEREIEERFKVEKLWQERPMFDDDTIDVFNQHFATAQLIEAMRSPAMPEHMRERFAIAIWTRAFILNDTANLEKITPDLIKYRPDIAEILQKATQARTAQAREYALLYFILKTPLLSPYIETGIGKTNNEQEEWSPDDWWCQPYDMEFNYETNQEVRRSLPPRPRFLTAAQSQTAQNERKRLRDSGDAPKYLAEKALAWVRSAPADRRIPEALYILVQANGWNKYGCGGNEEIRDQLASILRRRYPGSEWAAKLAAEESDR